MSRALQLRKLLETVPDEHMSVPPRPVKRHIARPQVARASTKVEPKSRQEHQVFNYSPALVTVRQGEHSARLELRGLPLLGKERKLIRSYPRMWMSSTLGAAPGTRHFLSPSMKAVPEPGIGPDPVALTNSRRAV